MAPMTVPGRPRLAPRSLRGVAIVPGQGRGPAGAPLLSFRPLSLMLALMLTLMFAKPPLGRTKHGYPG